jgi:hypothetical protein
MGNSCIFVQSWIERRRKNVDDIAFKYFTPPPPAPFPPLLGSYTRSLLVSQDCDPPADNLPLPRSQPLIRDTLSLMFTNARIVGGGGVRRVIMSHGIMGDNCLWIC